MRSFFNTKGGQTALSFAAADIICDQTDGSGSPFQDYCYLTYCVQQNVNPIGVRTYQEFSDYSWKDILYLIRVKAVEVDNAIRRTFGVTHPHIDGKPAQHSVQAIGRRVFEGRHKTQSGKSAVVFGFPNRPLGRLSA